MADGKISSLHHGDLSMLGIDVDPTATPQRSSTSQMTYALPQGETVQLQKAIGSGGSKYILFHFIFSSYLQLAQSLFKSKKLSEEVVFSSSIQSHIY